MSVEATIELVDEVVLGSARGGQKASLPLTLEISRSLTAADIPTLLAPAPKGSTSPLVKELRSQHHLLAQMIAKGDHDQNEIALLTGYSISRISILKQDPAFAMLVADYSAQRELVFQEVLDRMKGLGIMAAEELQARLEAEPDKWTKGELMQLMDRAGFSQNLPVKANGQGPGTGAHGPIAVQVNFVSDPRQKAEAIEVNARVIADE